MENEDPLLSIITVNLNNKEGLKKTVSSVLEQTFTDFEYIIIDGGSTDGSREEIELYSDCLNFWTSEPDVGIYSAMNKGIVKAKGKYLLFLNSGDHFYNKHVLKRNASKLEAYDLIYFNLEVIEKDEANVKYFPEELRFSYFLTDSLPHPATFIKRVLFIDNGYYDENLKIVSDWKFFAECICLSNCSYLRVNSVLSTHYLDGISAEEGNLPLIRDERRKVLKNSFGSFLLDYEETSVLKKKLTLLKNSRKIKILIKLGLIKKI